MMSTVWRDKLVDKPWVATRRPSVDALPSTCDDFFAVCLQPSDSRVESLGGHESQDIS